MKFSIGFAVLALPLLATAGPLVERSTPGPATACNTGNVKCCNNTFDSKAPENAALLGLLGLNLGSITGLVGLACNPITVIGAGGSGCQQQTVCCTGNNFNGLINVGCSPMSLGV